MEKQKIKIEVELMKNIKPFAERMFNVAKQGYIVEAEFQQGEQVVTKFATLDFDSIDSIVSWFLELVSCREFYVRHYKIVEQLKEKGFLPLSELTIDYNMTAKDYIEVCPDLDEVGKYVISRVMESIIQFGFVCDHEASFMKAYLLRSGNKIEQSLSRKNLN